jgi:hypothetical protein
VISLETWTTVRFTLYPVMLIFGFAWALFNFRSYWSGRCVGDAWAGWLGLAVAIQGASGLASLLIARTAGFGSLSSGVFTLGPLAVTVVIVSGSAALWWTAWRKHR